MKDVVLQAGGHDAPFDEDGNPTMCALEFAAWLAGEPHGDAPECVDESVKDLMIMINDVFGPDERRRLKPYIVRALGTAGDGQEGARKEIRFRSPFRCSCVTCVRRLCHYGGVYRTASEIIEEHFGLLEAILDPGGIHDVKDQEALVVPEKREVLAHA